MLSLERMTSRVRQGGGARHGLDGWRFIRLIDVWRVIVVVLVTVLVLNRYYSFCYNRLFLARFQGKPPAPNVGSQAGILRIAYLFNLLTVFTDVDLSLLDPTSYFGRCLCSGLFYA
ncbi:hypothetical protein [Pseudomonas sp.]|uniref:hypothetical protein n=1 Tax=Pseudomonas sp. TaxID=306 RepID=UPI00262E7FD8|nr:hypothetical protein [Pseudomonas sp.]